MSKFWYSSFAAVGTLGYCIMATPKQRRECLSAFNSSTSVKAAFPVQQTSKSFFLFLFYELYFTKA
jgi:hypothetical protein